MGEEEPVANNPQPKPLGPHYSLRALFIAVVVFGILCLVWRLAIHSRDLARAMDEATRVKHLALNLHNYHTSMHYFPPATTRDSEGRPFKSWRIAAVNFVEATPLYSTYDHKQPWNSPGNDAACLFHFSAYTSPRAKNKDKFCTNIFMPTGPGTVGESPVSLDDITDDHGTTILLLCHLKSDVHWHEPRDIHISEFTRAPGDPQSHSLSRRIISRAPMSRWLMARFAGLGPT
jgi:hypothetical protein